jgi:hypothetical protein
VKQKRQEGAKKAKEALISVFLPFLLLLAFFASISTFFMRPDFINVSSQQPFGILHCLNVNNSHQITSGHGQLYEL